MRHKIRGFLPCWNRRVSRFAMLGGAALIGSAFVVYPHASIANPSYDGQTLHLAPGESTQVSCVAGEESSATLNQFGDTNYYALECVGSSSQVVSQSGQALYEDQSNGVGNLHVNFGKVNVVCGGGSANLTQAGNTRYYRLDCTQ